jgi:D-arabinose 1-dehydrogenase-like Zn-dependent alcohol dehydrogenase
VGAKVAEAAGAGAVSGAVDFVGAPTTVQLALACLEKGGCLVIVGLYGGKVELSLPPIPLRAMSIVGSFTGSRPELQEFLALIRGGKVPRIPTVRRPLDQANQTLLDLEAGRLVGRGVLVP